jgi:hypothetical protein
MAKDLDETRQTGPLDFHEAQGNEQSVDVTNVAGTSGQEGAGQAQLPTAPHDDLATIGDEGGLVSSAETSERSDEKRGWLSTDEQSLFGDIDAT